MPRGALRPMLFYDSCSPPARSCLMLIKHLGIDVELKEIDLFKQEHLTVAFKKINRLHTVPVLKTDMMTLTDSHAILIHLAQTRDNSEIFPRDDATRIRIINRLFFECGLLFRRDSDMMCEIFQSGVKCVSHHETKIHEAYDFLNQYADEYKFMASNQMTIADFSIVTTLSTIDLVFPVKSIKWPKLSSWYSVMKSLPYYNETNQTGLNRLKEALKTYAHFDLPR